MNVDGVVSAMWPTLSHQRLGPMISNGIKLSSRLNGKTSKWNEMKLCCTLYCLECRLAQINIRFSFVQMDAYRLKGYWLVGWLAGWLPSLPWLCVSSVNSWYNIRVWLWSYRTNNVRTSDHETSASNALCSYYSFFCSWLNPICDLCTTINQTIITRMFKKLQWCAAPFCKQAINIGRQP